MNSASSFPIGTLICHMRIGTPRPASNTSFWSPASTSVLGPKRVGRGDGDAVPSSVTLKSACASAPAANARPNRIASPSRRTTPSQIILARLSRQRHRNNRRAGAAKPSEPGFSLSLNPGYIHLMTAKPQRTQLNPFLKLALEMGPLILFFFANARPALFTPLIGPLLPAAVASGERAGIFAATAVFMVAILIALTVSYALTRHLPVMALVTAVVVVVFGSLTLVLQDETFIKMKPTIIYVLFGALLLGGLLFNKPLLAVVFDAVFDLTDEGWRKLTLRWAIFFLALALLNEMIWRTQTTDFWVSFKVFGVVPLTFVFAALQYPLLQRYAAQKE